MTKGKIMEGVFAVNKPTMISSAQVIRDLQQHFAPPSKLFAPWIENETKKIQAENHNQRKRRRQKEVKVKIGHGGTLDPLATGVLITGVGKGTKMLQNFLECTKTYEAVILFGTSTDSYDRVGKVLRRAPYEHITKEAVEESLNKFRGKITQLPPLFSALKMNGKPLYEYAREGKPLPRQIERREVEVLELELVEWMEGDTHDHKAPDEEAGPAEINLATSMWEQEGALPAGIRADKDSTPEEFENRKRKLAERHDDLVTDRPASKQQKVSGPEQDATMSGGLGEHASEIVDEQPKIKGPPAAKIRMSVTSGFYVRSLCHDIGIEVGSGALMAELERTRQEKFEVGKNCLEYQDLMKGESVWGPKVEAMLEEWEVRNGGKASGESIYAAAASGGVRSEVTEEFVKGEPVKAEASVKEEQTDSSPAVKAESAA